MNAMWHEFLGLMHRGGPIMWPLLALCFVSLTLIFERMFFFLRHNTPGSRKRIGQFTYLLRTGQRDHAVLLAQRDRTIYGDTVRRLLAHPPNEAAAYEAVDAQRHRLERFMATISTIITAAPMLGILGTVLGVISSFQVLSTRMSTGDPRDVSQGIAEALITTAAGLVVAVISLFPFNAFRAQIDRSLTRLESLAAASLQMEAANPPPPSTPPAERRESSIEK